MSAPPSKQDNSNNEEDKKPAFRSSPEKSAIFTSSQLAVTFEAFDRVKSGESASSPLMAVSSNESEEKLEDEDKVVILANPPAAAAAAASSSADKEKEKIVQAAARKFGQGKTIWDARVGDTSGSIKKGTRATTYRMFGSLILTVDTWTGGASNLMEVRFLFIAADSESSMYEFLEFATAKWGAIKYPSPAALTKAFADYVDHVFTKNKWDGIAPKPQLYQNKGGRPKNGDALIKRQRAQS